MSSLISLPSLDASAAERARKVATVNVLVGDVGMRDFRLINVSARMKATVAKVDMVVIWACQSRISK